MNRNNPLFLLTLSAAFEYYDFVIYGLMVTYLGPLFFPNDNEMVSHLQAFSVFALGYMIRPLGGIILGAMGDLTNLKSIFVNSNFILAIATIALSLLPSYNQIGISATIAIIFLRLAQSFSFAAEMPGAMSLLKQNNQERKFGFIVSGAAIGSILATSMLYLLEQNFAREEILEFAWRIPFLLGAILCIISAIMRRKLPNTEAKKPQDKVAWVSDILLEYKKLLACVLLISISAYMILMNLFFPSFLPKFYNLPIKEVYLAITLSLVWSIFYAPIFAKITSKLNQITLLQSIIMATILLAFVMNSLLHQGKIILALCIYQSLIASFMVVIFPLMADSFASEARFTLMAASYNITYAIMAFFPNMVTSIATHYNGPLSMWLILLLLCVFALGNMSALYTPNRTS